MDTYRVTVRLDGFLSQDLADAVAGELDAKLRKGLPSKATLTVTVEATPAS